ncbi:unnamed protein product [Sphagnum compactum]
MIKSMGSSSGVAAAGLATDGPLQADAKMMEGGGAVVTPAAAAGSLEDGPPATTTTANATVAAAASAGAPAAAAADVGVPEAAAAALTNTATMTVNERRARESIAMNPYDVEAWTALCNEAQTKPIGEAAPVFEQFLATFPTAARYWRMYVDAQIAANDDEAVKQIFSRCLLHCLHVDLWRSYLRYMRKVNDSRGPEGRDEMRKAFEFMLSHIGFDITAGPVWLEYISFLKAAPALTPQEESQRMTAVRKAYQKAVLAPVHLVEQIWKEYENFENSVSRALAKGLLAEYQPKHFSARAVYRERKKYCEHIDANMLAVPPTGSYKARQQCLAWKQLLTFEKGNPQRLDAVGLSKHVAFTYEQCLMYLYHYPDIWYDYATWHVQNGSPDSAAVVFQRALKALPDTAVLHYAYAEFEEARGGIKEAKGVYETLISNDSTANALAYIQLMRFVRRTEGVDAARKVFFEARKAPACTYHVYVASANLELCIDKDPKVARNIFELGLKKYIHEPAYVLEYVDFLCRMNDDRNVRVLFERALSVLPPEESAEVWNRFLAFEQMYGDLVSMLKVEQRRKETLSQTGEDGSTLGEGSLQQLIARYRFLDLWPCSTFDLDHITHQQVLLAMMNPQVRCSSSTPGPVLNSVPFAVVEKAPIAGGTGGAGVNIVRPDVSRMVLYDPRQGFALRPPPLPPGRPPGDTSLAIKTVEDAFKYLPSSVGSFLARLPAVTGPFPDPEVVMTVLLQTELQVVMDEGATQAVPTPASPSTLGDSSASSNKTQSGQSVPPRPPNFNSQPSLDAWNSSALNPRPARQPPTSKRKDPEKVEEEDMPTTQARPPPRDVFRLRQLQRARVGSSVQSGSTSGGSGAFSGERSGSSE